MAADHDVTRVAVLWVHASSRMIGGVVNGLDLVDGPPPTWRFGLQFTKFDRLVVLHAVWHCGPHERGMSVPISGFHACRRCLAGEECFGHIEVLVECQIIVGIDVDDGRLANNNRRLFVPRRAQALLLDLVIGEVGINAGRSEMETKHETHD